jgi:hypothetical protein
VQNDGICKIMFTRNRELVIGTENGTVQVINLV